MLDAKPLSFFIGSQARMRRPRRASRFRERISGLYGKPLDREAKCRLLAYLSACRSSRSISKKALAVADALLMWFHNSRTGLCFPSMETIAARVDAARSTVQAAVDALEALGVLKRLQRRDLRPVLDDAGAPVLLPNGKPLLLERRASNCYWFDLPASMETPSKPRADRPSSSERVALSEGRSDPAAASSPSSPELEAALARLGLNVRGRKC